MSAKEMFEELGFDCIVSGDGKLINYVKCIHEPFKMDKIIIIFDCNKKAYECIYDQNYEINGHHEGSMGISVKLHKLIHQQLIELGWIESQGAQSIIAKDICFKEYKIICPSCNKHIMNYSSGRNKTFKDYLSGKYKACPKCGCLLTGFEKVDKEWKQRYG